MSTISSRKESSYQLLTSEIKELFTFHPQEWINGFRSNAKYPLFVRGDIDGFIALFINTLSTLLAVILSLQPILGQEIVYGRIVPGTGIAMLWGNLYYAYMARKLAYKEKRGDICAMPYGICTPGAFAFIYVIISPTYYTCISSHTKAYCQELAWYVALASNFFTGIVLLTLCLFGEFIRKNTPSVALLSSISGIGFAILALNEYLPIAEVPMVAFVPFTIVMLGYFAGGRNHSF
jgi:AGZA family xanthine/uracil permease-like MFS transporter